MIEVVGVRFKKAGKVYYFDPNGLRLKEKENVIIETSKIHEFGIVAMPNKKVEDEDVVLPLKKIIRKAKKEDFKIVEENEKLSKSALEICNKRIAERKLEMHLVDVEYSFDKGKVLFFFTADKRIDFRDLVKDLALDLKTRIELRQIGVRDEAKIIGGMGPCGRPLCCATYLGDFEPVSIKMAKDQNLSLNPIKISGACGRLLCCLKYENDEYERLRKLLPDVGEKREFPDGLGRVIGINILGETVKVSMLESEKIIEYSLEDLLVVEKRRKKK